MSLIRLDRPEWINKKSTKRLKIILRKCRINYNRLYNTMEVLKSYNLPIDKSVDNLYEAYLLKAATLDNIIFRRDPHDTEQPFMIKTGYVNSAKKELE